MKMRTKLSIPASHLHRRAFTMVEVILAIGIFGLVMIAIYASWSSIMRATRIGLTAAAEVQRTRIAIRSLEEALGGAVMYSDNPAYYGFFADTSADYAYLSFVARLPESFPGSGLFPGQSMRRVTFRVDEKKNLLLTQSTLLDVSEQPYTITLAPKTAIFALEFFNPRMNEWIPEWIATNALPQLVRVALDFGDKKQSAAVTIRSIPLTAFAITRGMPNTAGLSGGGGIGGGGRNPNLPADRRGQNGGFGSTDVYQGPRPMPPAIPPGVFDSRTANPGGPRNSVFPQ